MKLQVTIPETIVTLETQTGRLPEGTSVMLNIPVKGLKAVEAPPVDVTPPVVEEPTPEPPTSEPPTSSIPPPASELPDFLPPSPTFDRIYENVEFRMAQKRFDTLGKATDLGLSEGNWTIVLDVRFVNFDHHHRVIGSATVSTPGSSLQIGVLKEGYLWIDTFAGAMTGVKLELHRWYQLAITHNAAGEERWYVDGVLVSKGNVPVFRSADDIYVGRWVNTYADFDLQRVRIYPLLSDEEVKEL